MCVRCPYLSPISAGSRVPLPPICTRPGLFQVKEPWDTIQHTALESDRPWLQRGFYEAVVKVHQRLRLRANFRVIFLPSLLWPPFSLNTWHLRRHRHSLAPTPAS